MISFTDYVGFIKKIMKLMQKDYPMLAIVEVELTQEKEMDELPNRPSKLIAFSSFLLSLTSRKCIVNLAVHGALLYTVGKSPANPVAGSGKGLNFDINA